MKPRVATAACTLAALALCACGAATQSDRSSSLAITNATAGDLPPAQPAVEGAADRAETGATARIVLGARRQRSIEAFNRFQQAIARRDLAAIGSMLDASVFTSLDSGESLPREAAVADLETQLARADPNQLAANIAAFRPVARSSAEYRRVGRTTRIAMTADDWIVEPSNRVTSRGVGPSAPPVIAVMVRFIGDDPVIAGYNRSLTMRP